MATTSQKRWLTSKQLLQAHAWLLPSRLYYLTSTDRIPAHVMKRFGRTLLFDADAFATWIENYESQSISR